MKRTSRQRLLDAGMIVVIKAARMGDTVRAAHEARRMLQDHPDCGMTELEIVEFLLRVAIEHRVTVDTRT